MEPFQIDIDRVRDHARQSVTDGAVTAGYKADRKQVVQLLNEALATETVCVLRYKFHYFTARGLVSEGIRAEFLEHAREEQMHADKLAARIVQLNGKPALDPAKLTSLSHAQFTEGTDIVDMIREDLVAERVVVEIYSKAIRWLGDKDPTTTRLLKEILEKEEEHAEDLATLLGTLGDKSGPK
jgi:bacterioferritin